MSHPETDTACMSNLYRTVKDPKAESSCCRHTVPLVFRCIVRSLIVFVHHGEVDRKSRESSRIDDCYWNL